MHNITHPFELADGSEAICEISFDVENDGIGPYEYWGQKCVDRGTDYPAHFALVSATVDGKAATVEQRAEIEALMDKADDAMTETANEQARRNSGD